MLEPRLQIRGATVATPQMIEKFPFCEKHPEEKALYYCVSKYCPNNHQLYFCKNCLTAYEHLHLPKGIHLLTLEEGDKWQRLRKRFVDSKDKVLQCYYKFKNVITFYEKIAEKHNIVLFIRIGEDIQRFKDFQT